MLAERTEYLDGVRGFAALIVVFGHCSNAGMDIIPTVNLTATGKVGVWLFFMLSAFLLTDKTVTQLSAGLGPLRVIGAYALRRFLRIMPLYLALLITLYTLGSIDARTAFLHAALIEGNDHLWTIPVEMKFYVLLPLLAFAFMATAERYRLALAVALLALSAGLFFLLSPPRISGNSLSLVNYLSFFSLGILVLIGSSAVRLRIPAVIALFGVVAAVLLHPRVISAFTGITPTQAFDLYLLPALAMAMVFLAATQSAGVRRVFETKCLRVVGTIAFGLYLSHYYVTIQVAALPLPNVVKGSVVLVVSVIVAGACYFTIERPFLVLGARLARQMLTVESHSENDPSAASAAAATVVAARRWGSTHGTRYLG
jgi:peptidoglycan/LPS O-acetylase OafA/YrhL